MLIDNQSIFDREPNKNNWDLTFTKYITDYPFQGSFVPYSVTGVLANIGVEVARAENVTSPSSYTNFNNHTFNTAINSIPPLANTFFIYSNNLVKIV